MASASIVALLLCLFVASIATSEIHLRSRTIDSSTLPRFSESPHLRQLDAAFADHTLHQFFVIAHGSLDAEQIDALANAGAEVKFFFPETAYLVVATTSAAQRLEREFDFIDKVVHYAAEHKIADEALTDMAGPQMQPMEWTGDPPMSTNDATEEHFAAMVLASSHETTTLATNHRARTWADAIGALGLEAAIAAESPHVYTISVPAGNATNRQAVLEAIARHPETHFIERHVSMTSHNKAAQWVTQSNTPESRPLWSAGLRGGGQVVGVVDTGLDGDNCLFADPSVPMPYGTIARNHRKVIAYWKFSNTDYEDAYLGHGTHVAGTVAGSSTNPTVAAYSGMAPDAKLAFYDAGRGGSISVPWDLGSAMYPTFKSADAHIVTHSWGCDSPGNPASCNVYTAMCTSIDKFLHDNPDFLIIFSTGNAGSRTGSITTPATSKNVLAVGACGNAPNQNQLASFSSRGPAIGQRIKPDVVAPGNPILSARSDGGGQARVGATHCGTFGAADAALVSKSGTSMAAPVVAGSAALVRQYFTEGWYPTGRRSPNSGFTPSGALIKAVLIHSASHLSTLSTMATLDRYYANGFGRIELDTVLPLAGARYGLFVDDTSTVGQSATKSYSKTVYGGDVRVTLTWMDPESSPNSQANLVNNLDLKVTVGQTSYYGNMLPGNAADTTNNVERVIATAPANTATMVTVTVTGTRVAMGPQRFALVMTAVFSNTRTQAEDVDPGDTPDAAFDNTTSPYADGDLSGNMFYISMEATLRGVHTVDFNETAFADAIATLLNITAAQIDVTEMADMLRSGTTEATLKVAFDLYSYSSESAQALAYQLVDMVDRHDPALDGVDVDIVHARITSDWETEDKNTATSTWASAACAAAAAIIGVAAWMV